MQKNYSATYRDRSVFCAFAFCLVLHEIFKIYFWYMLLSTQDDDPLGLRSVSV